LSDYNIENVKLLIIPLMGYMCLKNIYRPAVSTYHVSVICACILLTITTTGCRAQNKKTTDMRCDNDRHPAVAGQFYPGTKDELEAQLKDLFARAAMPHNTPATMGIITPHAGYVFSGTVAASAFNQIDPEKQYSHIFILSSSHRLTFNGASVYSGGNYVTPLGVVTVDTALAKKLVEGNPCFAFGPEAHDDEHSLEVQLPFLQYRMKKEFKIIPIILGTQQPEMCKTIAQQLKPYLSPSTLFIISTDFSHYPAYSDAVKTDLATADAIVTGKPETLLGTLRQYESLKIPGLTTNLCGWTSVLTFLYLISDNNTVVLEKTDYKNSGDSKYGAKDRVVGYWAITARYNNNTEKQTSDIVLSDNEKHELLRIARNTLNTYLATGKIPAIDDMALPAVLRVPCGAFVTLHKHGNLRGCIGRFEASKPMYRTIQDMAISAATNDYRFSPVMLNELNEISLEISILTPMKKITSIDEIILGKHGIYIKKGMQGGTFLPQVATETGWTLEQFLGHCADDKAGLGWYGWKDADIFTYEALVFSEKK